MRPVSAGALLLAAVTSTATSTTVDAPGGARGGQAFLEPLIPIITDEATAVVPRSELANGAWEPIVPIVRDDGAEAKRTSEMAADWQPPPKPSWAIPPPVIVKKKRPPVPPRTPWSLALRFQGGYFTPDDVNAVLAMRSNLGQQIGITMALAAGVEYRPSPLIGVGLVGGYRFTPPVTIGDDVLYLQALDAAAAVRLYIPATDRLWFVTGPEAGVLWADFESHSGVAPTFTWRFAVQLREPDLPVVEVGTYFSRAKVDDDGFELDLSSIGVIADFHFAL